jgi:hypothetical protein
MGGPSVCNVEFLLHLPAKDEPADCMKVPMVLAREAVKAA